MVLIITAYILVLTKIVEVDIGWSFRGFISDPEELMDPIESKVFITEMSINLDFCTTGKSSPVDQPINQIQKWSWNHDQNNVLVING
ncbi:MAG: hypothetical protein IPI77_17465 [Saprospiraceae bacterium]|nr:hypothetical protein [Saprospiraceae bacterium]